MIRISALNESGSEHDSIGQKPVPAATKEAKEAEAFALYNVALGYQRQGDVTEAEKTFSELLQHDFVRDATRHVEGDTEGTLHPGLQLLYSTHKNMAAIAANREEYNSAMESYLEAIKIDTSEVTVWYKIGVIALRIQNFSLARLGFEQGLQCNGQHWPCLDNVITILYALNNYWSCLFYIAKALEKDDHYIKGHALKDQIFSEQPSLRQDSMELWTHCNPDIHTFDLDKEEAAEYVSEALEMRKTKQDLARVPKPEPIPLPRPITAYTWKSVGDCLIALYDKVLHSDSSVNLGYFVKFVSSVPHTEILVTPDVGTKEPELAEMPNTTEMSCTETETEPQPQSQGLPGSDEPATEQMEPSLPLEQAFTPVSQMDVSAVLIPDTLPVLLLSPSTPHLSMLLASQQNTPVNPVPSPAAVAIHDLPNPLIMELDDCSSSLSRRVPKRKRGLLQPDDLGGKRRSARVRNTSKKKEEEYINFQELLQTFLPSSLKQVESREETENRSIAFSEQMTPTETLDADSGQLMETIPLSRTEEEDVKKFIESQTARNNGTIDIIKQFLFALAERTNMKWSNSVCDIYLQLYARIRKNLIIPNYLGYTDEDIPVDMIAKYAKMILVWTELQMDVWMMSKSRHSMSPGASPRSHSPASPALLSEALPVYCMEDLWYITGLTPWDSVLQEFWIEYCIRVYWMRSRFFMIQNQMEEALLCFNKTIEYLMLSKEENNVNQYRLVNCKFDCSISEEEVKNKQESLQRCQSLDETQRLFEAGNYGKVAEILLQMFKSQSQKIKGLASDIPERQAQLILLQDSLFRTNEFQKCLLWGEVSLNEALQHYKKALSNEGRAEWANTLIQIFTALNRVLDKDLSTIKGLPSKNLVRLTQNLIWVIECILSAAEYVSDLPIATLLPIVLLYKLIKHEEEKIRSLHLKSQGSGATNLLTSLTEGIPSSLMLLNIAHECLGRHSWCTKSNGSLLLFFIDILKSEMGKPSCLKQELDIAFEQCVYCLYGYPNKKGKSRRLQDHNSPQIYLTWQNSFDLFQYFKPKTVPEFDSYKADTINAEFESFLKRILILIPENCQPGKHEDTLAIQEYIEGNTNSLPSPPENQQEIPSVVREIYYLLADYYFKNKEQSKAVKFYMYDLSVNPCRLDSWAGMALARMSQLEHKLDSMELKLDVPHHKKSIAALRCFRKAVSLDEYMSKLWIEYGSLAYQLHSHSSRQLKLKSWFHLPTDLEEIASQSRQEMLQIAYNCYKKASECEGDGQEEEWLQHYMMGKCLEKMRKPPIECLSHYKQAAFHLYEDNATYPKKITYAFVAPRLAVESLEVFYRLHVAILKLLLLKKADLDFGLLERFIDEAADSPFARGREKRHEKRERDSVSSATDDTMSPAPPPKKCKLHTTSTDHNYSRMKSSTDSSDSSMDICKDSVLVSDLVVSDSSRSQSTVPGGTFNEPLKHDNDLTPSADDEMNKRQITDSQKCLDEVSDSVLMKDLAVSDSSQSQSVESELMAGKTSRTPCQKLKISPFSMASILGENTDDSVGNIEAKFEKDESDVIEFKANGTVEVAECAPDDDDDDDDDDIDESATPEKVTDISAFSGMEENSAIDDELEKLCRSVAEGEDEVQFPQEGMLHVDEPSCSSTPKKIIASFKEESCEEVFYPAPSVEDNNETSSIHANSAQRELDLKPELEIESRSEAKKLPVMEISEELKQSISVKEEKEDPNLDTNVIKNELVVLEISSEQSDLLQTTSERKSSNNESTAETEMDIVARMAATTKEDMHQINNEKQDDIEGVMETVITAKEMSANHKSSEIPSVKNEHILSIDSEETRNNREASHLTLKAQPSTGFDVSVVESDPKIASKIDTEKDIKIENTEKIGIKIDMIESDVTTMTVENEIDISVSPTESDRNINADDDRSLDDVETATNIQTRKENLSTVDNKNDVAMIDQTENKNTEEEKVTDLTERYQNKELEKSLFDGSESDTKLSLESRMAKTDRHNSIVENGNGGTVGDKDELPREIDADTAKQSTEKKEQSSGVLCKELISKCIKALTLCLHRFPTHYKSLYRLANIYYRSPYHKNLEYAKDLLIGSTNWQKMEHMPIQGLFGERKQNNFFQGIWKLPIQEIDRSGSFASHVNRSVLLLLNVLRELKDTLILLFIHTQLMRTPDTGRKYLRDAERVHLAKLALRYTLESIASRTDDMKSVEDEETLMSFLTDVHKAWQHATTKLSPPIERANKLLVEAFLVVRKKKVKPGIPLLDQAIKFCQFFNTIKSTSQFAGLTFLSPEKSSGLTAIPVVSLTVVSQDHHLLSVPPSEPLLSHQENPTISLVSPEKYEGKLAQMPVIRLKPLSPAELKGARSIDEQKQKSQPKVTMSRAKDSDKGQSKSPLSITKSQTSSFQEYFERAVFSQGISPKKSPGTVTASNAFQESFDKSVLVENPSTDSKRDADIEQKPAPIPDDNLIVISPEKLTSYVQAKIHSVEPATGPITGEKQIQSGDQAVKSLMDHDSNTVATGIPKTTTLLNVTSNINKIGQDNVPLTTNAVVSSASTMSESESEEQEVISIDDSSSDSAPASPASPEPAIGEAKETKEICPPNYASDSQSSASSYKPSSDASSRSSSPTLTRDSNTVPEDVSWMVGSKVAKVTKPGGTFRRSTKPLRPPYMNCTTYPRETLPHFENPLIEKFQHPTPRSHSTVTNYPHIQQAATATATLTSTTLSQNRMFLRFNPETGMFTSSSVQAPSSSGDDN